MAPKRRKTQTGEGETSNPPPPPQIETGEREEIVVTIDPHSLECSICFEPLFCPVYQCINGHVACLSCWKKVQNNCPTCNKPIGGRNIALEAVLESIHHPCPNANLGCQKSVSYSQMQLHTDTCEFGPSLCPIPGCAHKAFSGQWKPHFVKHHWHLDYVFIGVSDHHFYGKSCTIRFDDNDLDRYYTFLGPGNDVFLLVKEAIPNGNALTLYYIDLPDLGHNYVECKLRVQGGPYLSSSLQSESRVVSIKEWKRGEVHGSSLVLQSKFLLEKYMEINVLLNGKKS